MNGTNKKAAGDARLIQHVILVLVLTSRRLSEKSLAELINFSLACDCLQKMMASYS
jgi:hypothetical protein